MSPQESRWPKVSIVTPSLNQARYIERTIRSVLNQGYPNLEYIVVDGGSTDGSIDIIRKYESHIARWVSEPDGGQSSAVNKGFAMSSGGILGWQNSDDTYAEGALLRAVEVFTSRPDVGIVFGYMTVIDDEDRMVRQHRYTSFSRASLLLEGMNLHNTSAFWRRSVWEQAGGLDPSFHFAMDYDFFVRASRMAKCYLIKADLGYFRRHRVTKTSQQGTTLGAEEARRVRIREMPWLFSEGLAARVVRTGLTFSTMAGRALGYVLQGDLEYAVRGLSRRMTGRGW